MHSSSLLYLAGKLELSQQRLTLSHSQFPFGTSNLPVETQDFELSTPFWSITSRRLHVPESCVLISREAVSSSAASSNSIASSSSSSEQFPTQIGRRDPTAWSSSSPSSFKVSSFTTFVTMCFVSMVSPLGVWPPPGVVSQPSSGRHALTRAAGLPHVSFVPQFPGCHRLTRMNCLNIGTNMVRKKG